MNAFQRFSKGTVCILLILASLSWTVCAQPSEPEQKKYIKWMTFTIPYDALVKAKNIDIETHEKGIHIDWVDVLSYLGTRYGGNWERYRAKDMDALVNKLRGGQTIADLTKESKYYGFFRETYGAVLSNFIGEYQTEVADESGAKKMVTRYGLKVFSPIAKGYYYNHYDDFGDSRSFGYRRPHTGHDLMGCVGSPIIAVEGGIVEVIGWNRYGGWRVGIRSFDKKRSYYYAHLRKNHPYAKGLKLGSVVKSGDVIGYLGRTGYSYKENSNMTGESHLHFGMQVIFDESQKEGINQIWIDVYNIVNLLYSNRVAVRRDDTTKDYYRANDFLDLKYKEYYH